MPRPPLRLRLRLATLAAACVIATPPAAAIAGQDARQHAQPAPGKPNVVVERVENGPVLGAEFKYARVNHGDEFLLGGYAGFVFDNTLLIGGAGYWQVSGGYHDDYDCYGYYDCDGYYDAHGYGGLLLEWYALRTPAVALSARGLVGGGIATVGWPVYADVYQPAGRHGSPHPPTGGYYGYGYDQGYFVFEPQLNLTVRIAPGVAMVGGAGYRVIGAANGFEDQIQGFTGTFAIRFGGGR